MKICYVPRSFAASSQAIITQAEEICTEYHGQGYDLTLRQLYYQFVSRDLLANTQQSYKRLGSIVNDARLAGLIDWNHLVDRTRNLQSNSHWTSPESIIDACAQSYALDKWEGQEHHVEVWIEKEALAGVAERACEPLDVPYFSCKGYTSQSEMWSAGMRLQRMRDRGRQHLNIVHLGDHDPSGMDMTRDIRDRLNLFCGDVTIHRIALNMNQVEQYGPPPNPAKLTDARARGYVEEFGESSWELDALEPGVLVGLINEKVLSLRDEAQWRLMSEREDAEKEQLQSVSDDWHNIVENL